MPSRYAKGKPSRSPHAHEEVKQQLVQPLVGVSFGTPCPAVKVRGQQLVRTYPVVGQRLVLIGLDLLQQLLDLGVFVETPHLFLEDEVAAHATLGKLPY